MEREELLALARTAALRAYAPYSQFRVGAAIVVRTGDETEVYTAANVENASYGLTLCAERAAIAAALTAPRPAASGHGADPDDAEHALEPASAREITQVAVACIDAHPDAPASQRTPCGACRQWLAELAPDATYFVDGIAGDLKLDDLLPLAFRLGGR